MKVSLSVQVVNGIDAAAISSLVKVGMDNYTGFE
jgi:hypothetical protein